MRKSEKLSDAIGEISDDIIEEAYTYKPKHDMHQRKASFKWRAAVAVLAMLVLAGVGVSVGGGTSFFRLGTIVSRFTGKAAKVVYRIQGIPVTQQEIQAGVALRVENGETVKTAKKEVIKDIITKKTLYVLAKKNGSKRRHAEDAGLCKTAEDTDEQSGEPERNPRFLCGIRWRECLLEEYGAGYSSESCGAQVYRQPDRNADGGRNQTGGI